MLVHPIQDKQRGDDRESGTVADTGGTEYELSHGEEQIMRIGIDGLHTAGLAMGFQVSNAMTVTSRYWYNGHDDHDIHRS